MNEPTARVGPYTPQQILALGAQTTVWLADSERGVVVLKVARAEEARPALLREAKVLQRAEHPNLVRLLDAAPDGEWIALERIDGIPMDRWSIGRTVEEVINVGIQVADALGYLHHKDVIHGDVKPSNVLVGPDGLARLIDLGIASDVGSRAKGFRGTLGYAAPEVLDGRPVTGATDLYGLGALLYTALTQRTPFVAPDPTALAYLPLVSLPPPPATFRPEIPAALNTLLLTLLVRDPERRPSAAARVREALERCRGGLPGSPVLGMLEEREALYRAVVGASDGEGRVVVVYGVPGSGRRTLIAEAVDYARREGLPYLRGTDPASALTSLREAGRPSVLVMKAGHRGTTQLAETVLRDDIRCLLLLHADRPLPELADERVVQLTPAPLSATDAVRLARIWNADLDQAEIWWRQSMGLPIAILGRIRSWRRMRGMTQTQHAPLPSESKRVYEALKAKPKHKSAVSELATDLQMSEHVLLDHCEVLFAEDLIEPADDGLSLVLVRSRSST